MLIRHEHAASPGSKKLAGAQAGAMLWSVNVNKAAAGSTLTVYDGIDNTGDIVAIVDCGGVGSWWYACLMNKGIYYTVAGGSPDVTIGFG